MTGNLTDGELELLDACVAVAGGTRYRAQFHASKDERFSAVPHGTLREMAESLKALGWIDIHAYPGGVIAELTVAGWLARAFPVCGIRAEEDALSILLKLRGGHANGAQLSEACEISLARVSWGVAVLEVGGYVSAYRVFSPASLGLYRVSLTPQGKLEARAHQSED